MKKMNRVIAAFAAMIMVLTLAAGCGSNNGAQQNSVVGKWTVVSAELQGEEFDPRTSGMAVGMEFKDDGSVALEVTSSMFPDASEQNFSGTWTQDGDSVTVTANDSSVDGKIEGETLTFTDGNTKLILEKE